MGMKLGLGKNRELVLKHELERIVSKIKELSVIKVILFGSLEEQNVRKTSDIDIVIIKNTKKSFIDRLDEVYQKTSPKVAVDFFVYTPNEIEQLKKTNFFVRRMLERGKVLYEART